MRPLRRKERKEQRVDLEAVGQIQSSGRTYTSDRVVAMTRETKIGLLVGLAFIIVIGILLSDQLMRSTEPPSAPLANVGDTLRKGTVTPASHHPPVTRVVPQQQDVSPETAVPTQEEM